MTTTERTSPQPSGPDGRATAPASGASGSGEPMPGAGVPVAAGPVPWVGVVLALTVTVAGVACLHDALRATGVVAGPAWLDAALTWAQSLRPASWMIPLALVLAALAVWLLVVGVRPRRRTAIALRARTGVFLRLRDVQRLASTAALGVAGVTWAGASAARRRVTVDARVTGGAPELRAQVAGAVTDRLSVLEPAPHVTVRVRATGGR